jgi:hypothetical protein
MMHDWFILGLEDAIRAFSNVQRVHGRVGVPDRSKRAAAEVLCDALVERGLDMERLEKYCKTIQSTYSVGYAIGKSALQGALAYVVTAYKGDKKYLITGHIYVWREFLDSGAWAGEFRYVPRYKAGSRLLKSIPPKDSFMIETNMPYHISGAFTKLHAYHGHVPDMRDWVVEKP